MARFIRQVNDVASDRDKHPLATSGYPAFRRSGRTGPVSARDPRGVRGLERESAAEMPITELRVSPEGLHKSINAGLRAADVRIDYLEGFLMVAGRIRP